MKKCVERDAVMQMINDWAGGYSYIEVPTEWAEDEVRKLPAVDAVPVVRCKDCKWRPRNMGMGVEVQKLVFPSNTYYEDVCPYSAGDPWYNDEPDPDGYCHLGQQEVIDN